MRKSTIAVLLSALVLPGSGHLYLKRPGRGIALIGISLATLWIILAQAMRQAAAVVDRLETEGGALDPAHISDLVVQTSNSSGSTLGTIATVVLVGCWLFGIVDAWRLGRKADGHTP